uniref:RING-type domain-containing protein n=1 Tax=Sinocyclocheilus rhinocerous TaxID=307959 RepID=A0A673FMG9_9TELE
MVLSYLLGSSLNYYFLRFCLPSNEQNIPEEDLHCPVCSELFTNPVVLECSHSFCKTCIDNCWNGQFKRICPVCRTPCLSERPPASLVLMNIVESFRVRQQSSLERTEQSREESQERESTQSRVQSTVSKGQQSRLHPGLTIHSLPAFMLALVSRMR